MTANEAYYFTGQKYGLDAIRNKRLKIARINELNDPFELMSPVFETREERLTVDRWRRQMSEKYGILCMSANWQHPLQWGHYADKSKGICLGFDTMERRKFTKVNYVAVRPTFTALGLADLDEMSETTMKLMLHQKFDSWSYEAEYRSFIGLTDSDPETGLYFAEFAPTLKLAEVILGYRSTATRADVAEALGDAKGVEVFMSRPGFQEFEVVRNRNEDAWK